MTTACRRRAGALITGLVTSFLVAVAAAHAKAPPPPNAEPGLSESLTDPDLPTPHSTMTVARLSRLILRIDRAAKRNGNLWELKINKVPVTVIADPEADRMRIVIGIIEADKLTPELMTRLMQANFDTALDARYALAHNVLWGTFIHPLGSLTDKEFLAGLVQTINLALTFGTTFSSGVLTFGGGDSQDILRQQMDEDAEPAPADNPD